MFTGEKYVTIGIKNTIPEDIQVVMWSMIEELRAKGIKLDYLQVFQINEYATNDCKYIKIIHRQEVPPYKEERLVIANNTTEKEKIFVISSIDEEGKEYSTMLLASEY